MSKDQLLTHNLRFPSFNYSIAFISTSTSRI
jgi:hypothetical protein